MDVHELALSCWNINGWTVENKTLRETVIKSKNSDIMCLVETHLVANDDITVDGYTWYDFKRSVKHIRAPKGSGGIGILVKDHMLQAFTVKVVDKSLDGILGIAFTSKTSSMSFIVYVCYLPPENSVWGRNSDYFFSHLVTELYQCSEYDLVFVCGDFNARIGEVADFVNEIDGLKTRNIIDTIRGGHCETFIDFVKDSRLCIVNGRVTPQHDNFTFVSGRGKSVVDYLLTMQDGLDKCTECKTELTSELIKRFDCVNLLSQTCKPPDHSMLTVNFVCNIDILSSHDVAKSGTVRNEKRYKFDNVTNDFMSSENWKQSIADTITRIENCTTDQSNIDIL